MYTAGTNGTITGLTLQIVSDGASGTTVTAVPNTGYHFVKWSDEETSASRTDNNADRDINVSAIFALDLPPTSNYIPVAIQVNGNAKVGNTLSAQLLDANGSVTTTSSAVTYTWYRLSTPNSEDGIEIGSEETYNLVSDDARKYIKLMVEFDDKKFEYITSQISKKSSNNNSGSSSNSSSSSSKTEEIKADVTNGSGSNSISQTKVERVTASDGTKKDTVNYTESKAQETVDQLKKEGKDIARIVIPDTKNEVSETTVNILSETLSTLSSGHVNLEIENARISLPKQTIQGLSENGNLYFKLVPIKDATKQQEIQANANK